MFFWQWSGKDVEDKAFPHPECGINAEITVLADIDAAHRINL